MKRPEAGTPQGLFGYEHFQIAYATNDIDRACELFRARFGIRDFGRLEGPMPGGRHARMECAWAGGVMIELVTTTGPGSDFYVDRLPTDDFAIKLHHFGYLLRDETEWGAVHAAVAKAGLPIVAQGGQAGFMKHCFVGMPGLAHLCEYVLPEAGILAYFEGLPVS
jgi:catechol 2,3-dioxygenase-like lactoylglutathione lyase family enzyme